MYYMLPRKYFALKMLVFEFFFIILVTVQK